GFVPPRTGNGVAAPIAAARPVKTLAVNTALHESSALPIPHQFVLNVRGAKRVSVVGDFNEWNRTSAPMARSADGTLWSTTISAPKVRSSSWGGHERAHRNRGGRSRRGGIGWWRAAAFAGSISRCARQRI